MDLDIIDIIRSNFKEEEQTMVINELTSIELEHVMAKSEYNLRNTRLSILKLANGDLNEVIALTKHAKTDFRDVVMWATQKE